MVSLKIKFIFKNRFIKGISFCLFLFCINTISAQLNTGINKQNINVEGLGIGMRFSINYEYLWKLDSNSLAICTSVGIAPNFQSPIYYFSPLKLSLLIGKSHFKGEIGFSGLIGYSGFESYIHGGISGYEYDNYLFPFLGCRIYSSNNKLDIRLNSLFIFSNVNNYGYRSRLPFVNYYGTDKSFYLWPGLCFGYNF